MDGSVKLRGLTIAPGVIETIIAYAIAQVDGVAAVGGRPSPSGVLPAFGKKAAPPGLLVYEEDGSLIVDVHIQVFYGYRLPDIADNIRAAVSGALESQTNIAVDVVHVTIDAIQFAG